MAWVVMACKFNNCHLNIIILRFSGWDISLFMGIVS